MNKILSSSCSPCRPRHLFGMQSGALILLLALSASNTWAQPPAKSSTDTEASQSQDSQSQEDKEKREKTQEAASQAKQENPKQTPVIVTADATDWIVNKPTGAMAEFKTPVKPRFVERMFTPLEELQPIKVRNHITAFNNGEGVFVFSYHDLQEAPVGEAITTTLQGAMLGSIANVEGRKITEGNIRYKDHPGIAFEFRYAQSGQIFKGTSRCLLIGKRQYQITGIMREDKYDQKIVDLFLNSFRLIEPKEEKTDKTEAGAKEDPLKGSNEKASSEKPDDKEESKK